MSKQPLPAVPYLKVPEEGTPYLEGYKCSACGAVFLDERPACAKCYVRGTCTPYRLSNKGTLYNHTIIRRTFPGIEVPFVFVIVDMEGGGCVRGNLVGMEDPTPEKLPQGMPVEVIYEDAGRSDSQGNDYIAHFFRPV